MNKPAEISETTSTLAAVGSAALGVVTTMAISAGTAFVVGLAYCASFGLAKRWGWLGGNN